MNQIFETSMIKTLTHANMITPFGRDIAALSYSWMFHLTIENKLSTDETSI